MTKYLYRGRAPLRLRKFIAKGLDYAKGITSVLFVPRLARLEIRVITIQPRLNFGVCPWATYKRDSLGN